LNGKKKPRFRRREMKNTFAVLIVGLGMLTVVIGVAWGVWQMGRVINYKLSYRSMVQNEIRQMVKPEALK
jgi:cytochrome oxidase assembly protein ShyY1